MAVRNITTKLFSKLFHQKHKTTAHSAVSYKLQCFIYVTRTLFVRNDIINCPRKLHTAAKECAKVAFKLSDIGEGIREVVVKEWYVKEGDKVSQFDNICEVQSDKASVTITSRYDGVITKLYYNIDDVALVGQPLVDVETVKEKNIDIQGENILAEAVTGNGQSPTTGLQELPLEKIAGEEPSNDNNNVACIPSVRRMARENNIELSRVKGTGKNGRIIKEDILRTLKISDIPNNAQESITAEKYIKKPISGFQKAMFKTMTDAVKIPHFVYCNEISVTKLSHLRKSLKDELEKNGLKITFLPFFIKAVSNALHKYQILNSSIDEDEENLIYKAAHNIGIAMDTIEGLAVPVIKNVDELRITDIAKKLNQLMKSGKDGTFSTDDLSGGTFTISNIGSIGGTYAAPVILKPQVAIIAIGTSRILPRFDDLGNVIPEKIVNISASADHRIVDGATMANFVNLIKKQIESPYLIFFNL